MKTRFTWGHLSHLSYLLLDRGCSCVPKEGASNSCYPSQLHSCQQTLW